MYDPTISAALQRREQETPPEPRTQKAEITVTVEIAVEVECEDPDDCKSKVRDEIMHEVRALIVGAGYTTGTVVSAECEGVSCD